MRTFPETVMWFIFAFAFMATVGMLAAGVIAVLS